MDYKERESTGKKLVRQINALSSKLLKLYSRLSWIDFIQSEDTTDHYKILHREGEYIRFVFSLANMLLDPESDYAVYISRPNPSDYYQMRVYNNPRPEIIWGQRPPTNDIKLTDNQIENFE